MKLYGSANDKSFNTLKIRFALAEIGAPYELVSVDLAKGESRSADFKRLNPHGKVPVLLDGDFALPESDAILWYLGEKHQDANLLPRLDGARRRSAGARADPALSRPCVDGVLPGLQRLVDRHQQRRPRQAQ